MPIFSICHYWCTCSGLHEINPLGYFFSVELMKGHVKSLAIQILSYEMRRMMSSRLQIKNKLRILLHKINHVCFNEIPDASTGAVALAELDGHSLHLAHVPAHTIHQGRPGEPCLQIQVGLGHAEGTDKRFELLEEGSNVSTENSTEVT